MSNWPTKKHEPAIHFSFAEMIFREMGLISFENYSLTKPKRRFWWKWECGPHSISAPVVWAEMEWGPHSHFHQNLLFGLVREYATHALRCDDMRRVTGFRVKGFKHSYPKRILSTICSKIYIATHWILLLFVGCWFYFTAIVYGPVVINPFFLAGVWWVARCRSSWWSCPTSGAAEGRICATFRNTIAVLRILRKYAYTVLNRITSYEL